MKQVYFFFALVISLNVVGQDPVLKAKELEPLIGEWTGSLTYINYGSGEPYTMPAKLSVAPGKKDEQFTLLYQYPKEPKANRTGKIVLSKNGRQVNKKPLTSVEQLDNGLLQVITESTGRDDNRKATIRNIYILGAEEFIIRKEVQFENTEAWLTRNEYSFKRPN